MAAELTAIAFALSTALLLSVRNMTLRMGLTKADAIVGVFLAGLISVPLSALLALLQGDLLAPLNYQLLNVALLGAAGIIHYLLGRVFIFSSIKLIGAARATTILQAYILIAAALSLLFLGEAITSETGIGLALVIPGLMFVARSDPSAAAERAPLSREAFRKGLLLALLAMIVWAIPPVLVRPSILSLGSPLVGNVISNLFGTAAVIGLMLPRHDFGKIAATDRRSLKILTLAGLLSGLSQISQYTALSLGNVSLVIPLTSTHILLTMTGSYLFMQRLERINLRVILGGGLIISGLFLIA